MDSLAFSFQLLLFFANLFLLLGAFSTTPHKNDFLECLTLQFDSSNSIIYTPNNASYASLLRAQNPRPAANSPYKPLLIFTPLYESQIQSGIYCSKKLGIQIRVRSGGHDYEGLSYTSITGPFVVIHMRNFRSISINTEDKTAWVQVGATLGQLYHALARQSKTLAFPAGACPTVGVGGHFSGGGYGMMSRKHAIASDQIVDAIVMNADGQTMDRASMGEDHFWAIRGGGGTSFGIILAFKLNLVTVPETVTVSNISRTLEQNATRLLHRWQYVANKIDENLVIKVFIHSVTSPITKNRVVQASFTSLFLGRARDLIPLMEKEFPELGLVEKDCAEMSWIESVLFFAGLQNQPLDALLDDTIEPGSDTMYNKGKSDIVTQAIPVYGLKGIWRFFNEQEGDRAEIQLNPYGGALNGLSESETPFPHRSGTLFSIHYAILWYEAENAEGRQMDWIRRLYRYMAPYVSKSPRFAYINYRDLDIGMNNNQGNTSYEQASVWGLKYFKNNFDRLVRVKTKVDPSNFFRNEQSIPPLYEEIASA